VGDGVTDRLLAHALGEFAERVHEVVTRWRTELNLSLGSMTPRSSSLTASMSLLEARPDVRVTRSRSLEIFSDGSVDSVLGEPHVSAHRT
jgi:hypothetical protein